MTIDYNRGVTKRIHPSGVEVYMYNDAPGVFLNAYGNEVDEKLAGAAGYDVVRLGRDRLKQERMSQAMTAIEQELATADDIIEVEIAERKGFKIVGIGLGRFNVLDPDGGVLTPHPTSEEMAYLLLDQMAPVDAPPEPDPKSE